MQTRPAPGQTAVPSSRDRDAAGGAAARLRPGAHARASRSSACCRCCTTSTTSARWRCAANRSPARLVSVRAIGMHRRWIRRELGAGRASEPCAERRGAPEQAAGDVGGGDRSTASATRRRSTWSADSTGPARLAHAGPPRARAGSGLCVDRTGSSACSNRAPRDRTRLFRSAGERDAMRALFARGMRRELEDTIAKAAVARQHRFCVLRPGVQLRRRDPVARRSGHAAASGRTCSTPTCPCTAANVGYGDVKHVWELNRHQFLMDLAQIVVPHRTPRAISTRCDGWCAAGSPPIPTAPA